MGDRLDQARRLRRAATRPARPTPSSAIEAGSGTALTVIVSEMNAAPDWTVAAYDVASKYQMQSPELMLSLDKSTGHNGDKLHLSITRIKAASQFGISELALQSSVNGVSVDTWWALVE